MLIGKSTIKETTINPSIYKTNWQDASILVIDDDPDFLTAMLNEIPNLSVKASDINNIRKQLIKATKNRHPYDFILINADVQLFDIKQATAELKSRNLFRKPVTVLYTKEALPADAIPNVDIMVQLPLNTEALTSLLNIAWNKKESHYSQLVEQLRSRKTRALIVEDDDINLKIVTMMLSNLSCEASSCKTGRSALETLAQESFDIILMDIGLPDMDGYSITEKIRANETGLNYNTPIIALTAFISDRELNRCFDVGMDDIITKPVNIKELQLAIAANHPHLVT